MDEMQVLMGFVQAVLGTGFPLFSLNLSKSRLLATASQLIKSPLNTPVIHLGHFRDVTPAQIFKPISFVSLLKNIYTRGGRWGRNNIAVFMESAKPQKFLFGEFLELSEHFDETRRGMLKSHKWVR